MLDLEIFFINYSKFNVIFLLLKFNFKLVYVILIFIFLGDILVCDY